MRIEFVAKDYPLWLAIVTGFGWLLIDVSYVVSDTETILDHIATLLSVASAVMLIVWAFKAKLALQAYALNEFKFELKMNPFYTFILASIISYIALMIWNQNCRSITLFIERK